MSKMGQEARNKIQFVTVDVPHPSPTLNRNLESCKIYIDPLEFFLKKMKKEENEE